MNQLAKDYDVVHIVFGRSVLDSMKNGLPMNEKVIGFPELFSTGPILDLHKDTGLTTRYDWLEKHLLCDVEDLKSDKMLLREAFLAVAWIPEHLPVVIWTGDNAHEQMGMRLALYLLKDKANDICLINTTRASATLLSEEGWGAYPIHSGEIIFEDLNVFYGNNRLQEPLSLEQRKQFEQDWIVLAATREVLRVWENGEILSVPDDFYDDFIIDTARRLHDGNCGQKDFMKSARVIGAVLGDLDQYVGDQYLEYRLRHLIINDVFEIQGVPKAMRFYSVRLR